MDLAFIEGSVALNDLIGPVKYPEGASTYVQRGKVVPTILFRNSMVIQATLVGLCWFGASGLAAQQCSDTGTQIVKCTAGPGCVCPARGITPSAQSECAHWSLNGQSCQVTFVGKEGTSCKLPGGTQGMCSVTYKGNKQDIGNLKSVECVPSYTVGGTVSGLSGGPVVLEDNPNGVPFSIPSDGSFVFPSSLAQCSSYNVKVVTQPSGQTCTVQNATGKVSTANVTNVAVVCKCSCS